MIKKLLAITVLVMVASLSIAGCTSQVPAPNNQQTATAKTTATPSVKPSVSPSVKPSVSPSVKPSVSPSVTPSPQPTETRHNHNYHVIIHGQCVPAGCLMTDSYMAQYEATFSGNPRVTYSTTIKQCGPTYHTTNCTASDVFVEVTVVETGQVAHFDVNMRDQVIPFVDTVLNAGYMA